LGSLFFIEFFFKNYKLYKFTKFLKPQNWNCFEGKFLYIEN
jgi:hypothetical protein